METFENHRLGIDDEEIEISSSEEHHRAAVLMARQCRREVNIISRRLDPAIYNLPGFVDTLKATLLANRRARVRVIVFEPRIIVRRGHLLLDMQEYLPSCR